MELDSGLLKPPRRDLCSRMQVCASSCSLLQMRLHICMLVLSGLVVSSQLGLEDVFFSPQDQTVREGEGAFLRCVSGESSPPASITWLKDGNLVTAGRHTQGEYGGGHQQKTSATLHLFNVTLEDEGIYVCHTHNDLLNISKRSKPAKLTVQGVPRRLQIIQGPDNITVAIGTEISMHCTVRGFPVPMVQWFKDGCLLTNCSASFILQNNRQLLTFRNVSREDEGFYHCEASNQEETVKSQPAFLLPAEMSWSFVQQPSNLTVRRGENVTITCRPPKSRPAAQVSWLKNNQLLNLTASITLLPSGDLSFHSVQEDDSGSYFCRASNSHLQRFLTSRRATLIVLAPPAVKLWPQVLTVPVGARVLLECQVSGQPLPSISWVKRGHSKQTGGKIALGMRNATLLIHSARSYDEGTYVCEAVNPLGKTRSTALLRVAVSPVIVTFVGQVNCRVGAPVVLPCRAVGIQPITYTWTRGKADTLSPISTNEGTFIHEDGSLYISSVRYSDAGEYHCTAENRAGRHQRHVTLTVTDSTHNSPTLFPTFSSKVAAELKMPSGSLSHISQHTRHQPTTSPTQPLITQMQPPILPPPPHPHFQLADLHPKLHVTTHPMFTSQSKQTVPHSSRSTTSRGDSSASLKDSPTESQSPPRPASISTQIQQQVSEKLLTETDSYSSLSTQVTETSESSSKTPVNDTIDSLKFDLHEPSGSPVTDTMTHSVTDNITVISQEEFYSFQAEIDQMVTNTIFPPFHHDTSSQRSQTENNHFPLLSTQESQTKSDFSSTMSFKPKFHLELFTTPYQHPPMKPTPPSNIEPQQTKSYPHLLPTQTLPKLPQTKTELSSTQNLTSSNVPSLNQPINSSRSSSEVSHQVTQRDQLNDTQHLHPLQSTKSANDTELTDWQKRNTSQSPMTSNPKVTQKPPPLLEKHDIPIVVGVGVSLAFIFITVTFYSVVQKNEQAPTSRAAQRHLGVPKRHIERRTAGRTYENRAFEDDECVAVIEQSPNTSDTRARPPGPSLVTVQMEPTFEDRQEDTKCPTDNHSVTVETYPEPIVDTKIDPSLEEGCSLSQPSIQLHCADDWTSNRDENQSPCHETLPPPSSLPSCSPTPSPPSKREEGLHSSLTLHSTEPCGAPIHHSLSISRGNPPLLLTHHVSMGLTTVAVDVHFYPATTASMAVGSSTHISSVSNSTSVTAPLFSPTLVTSQENQQSTAMFNSTK